MTSLQLYEAVLVALNKQDAPNILLEDFNVLANKAVNNYINKRYNIYDVNQQTSDDLRVLKASVLLDVKRVENYRNLPFMRATYEVTLPSDYMHILNCLCIYDVKETDKCYNPGRGWEFPATRLTADLYSQVVNNYYNRPTYKKPYYYIHNVNKYQEIPTNPYENGKGTDISKYNKKDAWFFYDNYNNEVDLIQEDNSDEIYCYKWKYIENNLDKYYYSKSNRSNSLLYTQDGLNYNETNPKIYLLYREEVIENQFPRSINLKNHDLENSNYEVSSVDKRAGIRYGNTTEVRMEIRYGSDDRIFKLRLVLVDYIKTPQHINLTQSQLDSTKDISQVLEFPDYVCQEIVNELVNIIMEQNSDLRLQTYPIVNLSIANPVQQLTQQPVAQVATQ